VGRTAHQTDLRQVTSPRFTSLCRECGRGEFVQPGNTLFLATRKGMAPELIRSASWCRRDLCWNSARRDLRHFESSESGGEVNWLIGGSGGECCQPSILRMLIWPEASSAQNNMAAVSADGSTVRVLIRRLRSRVSHYWRQAWQGAADQTDFHSLRRAVATQLREAEVREADVAPCHTSDGGRRGAGHEGRLKMPTDLPPPVPSYWQAVRYVLAITSIRILHALAVHPRRVLKIAGWISGYPR
jgi:hypothetical protein